MKVKAKRLQKMSGGGDRVANGEDVRARGSSGQGQGKFGNRGDAGSCSGRRDGTPVAGLAA